MQMTDFANKGRCCVRFGFFLENCLILTRFLEQVTAFGKPELLERMTEVLASVSIAFSKMDTTRCGMLTWDQVETGLKKMGVQLEPGELVALKKRMDYNQDGKIDATEFGTSLLSLSAFILQNMFTCVFWSWRGWSVCISQVGGTCEEDGSIFLRGT